MIVSADAYNRSELRTVTVVVLTTTTQLAALPGSGTVPVGIDVVDADSVVNVTQIATWIAAPSKVASPHCPTG